MVNLSLATFLCTLIFLNFLAPDVTLELYNLVHHAPFQMKPLYECCWNGWPMHNIGLENLENDSTKDLLLFYTKQSKYLYSGHFQCQRSWVTVSVFFKHWMTPVLGIWLEKIINNPAENFITNALFTASSHFHYIKQLCVLECYKENIAKC